MLQVEKPWTVTPAKSVWAVLASRTLSGSIGNGGGNGGGGGIGSAVAGSLEELKVAVEPLSLLVVVAGATEADVTALLVAGSGDPATTVGAGAGAEDAAMPLAKAGGAAIAGAVEEVELLDDNEPPPESPELVALAATEWPVALPP